MATILSRLAIPLLLAGAAIGAPAFAAEPAEQAPSLAVRYHDLDLASDAGARMLDRRIHWAAAEVCPAPDRGQPGLSAEIRACRETALASARAQVEIALARARDGKAYAANTAKAPTPGL